MAAKSRTGTYFLPGLAIISAVIAADQYTKWMIMNKILRPPGAEAEKFWHWFVTIKKISVFVMLRTHFKHMVLSPFLNLVLVWNQGISFGMFDHNSPKMALVFIGVSVLISILLLMWLALSAQADVGIALSLIIGGAIGNMIDRVRFDAVVDFIDFHYKHYHWPAFNVADSCIVVGAGILMLGALFGGHDAKRKT